MKRSQLVFVLAVFAIVLTGVVFERNRRDEAPGDFALAPQGLSMRPFDVPGGDHRLAGRVVDEEGRPSADVRIHLWTAILAPGTAAPLHGDATDAAGQFAMEGLAAGTYEVALLQVGHPHTRTVVEVPVAGPVEWTLEPQRPPLATLPELRRLDLEGELLPPVGITGEEVPREGYEVLLDPATGEHPLSGAVQRRTRTDREGRFRIEGLAVATYRVRVLPPWAAGGTWPALDEVAYSHAEAAVPRPLRLRLRIGELWGRLVDAAGAAVTGALVTVRTAEDADRLWPPLTTDTQGAFLVGDLPPGPYAVRARAGALAWEGTGIVRIGERSAVELRPAATGPPD